MVVPLNGRTQTILKVGFDNDDEVISSNPQEVEESLKLIEDFKFFLATAPVNWQENQIIRRYHLNNEQGFVSCVFWNNLYYMTGTDIVKCCMYRMEKFGRRIMQKKKFEEGIFSDLRNLKCGIDATLEKPKSDFLQFLFRNSCLKTQKKQKVFFWFSIPHNKIFADALERDLKREADNQPSTTKAISDPALSFVYNLKSTKPLYEQLLKHMEARKQLLVSPFAQDMGVESLVESQQGGNIKTEHSSSEKYSRKTGNSEDDEGRNFETKDQLDDNFTEFKPDSPNLITTAASAVDRSSEFSVDMTSFEKDIKKRKEPDDDLPADYLNFEIEYPEQEKSFEKNRTDFMISESAYGQGLFDMYNILSPDHDKRRQYMHSLNNRKTGGNKNYYNQPLHEGTVESNKAQIYPTTSKVQKQVLFAQPSAQKAPFSALQPPFSAYNLYSAGILPQTVDQPLVGFEGIYTPQNPYGKDLFNHTEGIDMNSIIQPQTLQPPPSAVMINPFTAGFKPLTPYPWIQSPFLPMGTVPSNGAFYPQKTPVFLKKKPFQTSSTKVTQPKRPQKLRKISHTGPEIAISHSKAELHNKIKESAKQLQAQIQGDNK